MPLISAIAERRRLSAIIIIAAFFFMPPLLAPLRDIYSYLLPLLLRAIDIAAPFLFAAVVILRHGFSPLFADAIIRHIAAIFAMPPITPLFYFTFIAASCRYFIYYLLYAYYCRR